MSRSVEREAVVLRDQTAPSANRRTPLGEMLSVPKDLKQLLIAPAEMRRAGPQGFEERATSEA